MTVVCSCRPQDRRRRSGAAIVAVLVAGWIGGAADAGAQQQAAAEPRATRSAVVTFTTATITIDGTLDEPIWRSAPTIGELIQRQPNPARRPPSGPTVTLLRDRGQPLHRGHRLRLRAGPGHRHADGAGWRPWAPTTASRSCSTRFAISAARSISRPIRPGALVDGLAFANGQLNTEWDAIWNVRTRRTNEGWIAEFAIPFKSLSFPAGETTWGFNVARNIYRKLEDGRWSGARLETQFLQVSEAGEITNLRRPDAGHRSRRPAVHRRTLAAFRRSTRTTTSTGSRASICSTTSRPA